MNTTALETPQINSLTDLRTSVIAYLANPTRYLDIGLWNISAVTDFTGLFEELIDTPEKNELIANINHWDVSRVKNMTRTFLCCTAFNLNLSNWNVGNVKDMTRMFFKCEKFNNSSIINWDVSNVKEMAYMFDYCSSFNQDLSNWNVSQVRNMAYMFSYCISFRKNLNNWRNTLRKNAFKGNMFMGAVRCRIPEWYHEYSSDSEDDDDEDDDDEDEDDEDEDDC